MEGQSPLTPQTITHEQSLVTVSMPEQRPPQAEQQSLFEDNRVTADGAEPQGTQEESNPTCDWADRQEDETPDYTARVFWEPDADSEDGGDTKALSSTTVKIVRNAFCRSLKPEKRKDIKKKQPIPDTLFTKVPKLDPTIQSRMSATAKHTDKGLSGMQGYVLDVTVPLVNLLESARNGTLTANDAAESA